VTTRRGSKFSGSGSGRDRRSPSSGDDGAGDSESHILCRLCHRWFRAITYTHLRYRHGIEDPRTYKEEFSVEKITAHEVRQRIAEQKFLVDRHATDFIRKHWGKVPLKEITRYLGVNASTVRAHALRLGLGLLVEKWSEPRVIQLLKDARRAGLPLNSGEARHGLPGLYKAALRLFGSWRAGLARAGIPYEQVSRRGPFERWTRERILEEIREIIHEGKESDYLFLQSRHSKLYAAARNHFGNWAKALEAAGPLQG
jgi:hypothetical protein